MIFFFFGFSYKLKHSVREQFLKLGKQLGKPSKKVILQLNRFGNLKKKKYDLQVNFLFTINVRLNSFLLHLYLSRLAKNNPNFFFLSPLLWKQNASNQSYLEVWAKEILARMIERYCYIQYNNFFFWFFICSIYSSNRFNIVAIPFLKPAHWVALTIYTQSSLFISKLFTDSNSYLLV